jgi:GntR family transcriptional regulator/MocR family aminotransferase
LAETADVGIYETSQYWKSNSPARENHILLGFSAIKKENIEPGIRALAKAWFA